MRVQDLSSRRRCPACPCPSSPSSLFVSSLLPTSPLLLESDSRLCRQSVSVLGSSKSRDQRCGVRVLLRGATSITFCLCSQHVQSLAVARGGSQVRCSHRVSRWFVCFNVSLLPLVCCPAACSTWQVVHIPRYLGERFTGVHLAYMSRQWRAIEVLGLAGCKHVDDAALRFAFINCHNLRRVFLSDCPGYATAPRCNNCRSSAAFVSCADSRTRL